MNWLIQARAATALSLRSGRDNRREGTLGYVSGSAVWGALSAAHARMRPNQRDQFAEFFLRRRVCCGNLYPCCFKNGNPVAEDQSPVRPLPRTARTCKRFQGFHYWAEQEDEVRHGTWDSLIGWAVFVTSDCSKLPLEQRECPRCQEPLDGFTGFFRRGRTEGEWAAAECRRGAVTRTGISRERGTAADQMLYSREYMAAGDMFVGEWTVDGVVADDFQQFLEEASNFGIRVGNNRTRGLGRLVFPKMWSAAAETADDIEGRARKFDDALKGKVGNPGHAFYLPLTLTADCIWPDRAGRYRLRITGEALQEAWGIGGAKLIYCNGAPRRVSGWSNLWGLPKADEYAIGMGAVFLFGFKDPPGAEVWRALAAGQLSGLGNRRAEGFGAVRVGDPFHYEVNGV
jgi:CRISPR-associated protein Csx10